MRWRLVYEDVFGNCKIVVPCAKYRQTEESEENALGRLWLQAIPGVIDFLACLEDKLPKDEIFRDAWKKGDTNEPIKIDFAKAMEMHRQRLKIAAAKKSALLQDQLNSPEAKNNLPLRVAIKRTCEILETIHEDNLTHCKTIEDIKYAIPRELHDVWHWYPPTRFAG